MKLTVTTDMYMLNSGDTEIRFRIDDGQKEHILTQIVPDELMKNKDFLTRQFDGMWYEMRKMMVKHFAIKEPL